MKNTLKKAAAFALSAALVTGTLPANVGGLLGNVGIVANAATDSYTTTDAVTGDITLHLSGVIESTSYTNQDNDHGRGGIVLDDSIDTTLIKYIVADAGTILPDDCSALFNNAWNDFDSWGSLESVDLSNIDTSNVQDTSDMFQFCTALKSVNLSGLDFSNVDCMTMMFTMCGNLETINWSGMKTNDLQDVSSMFDGCSSLTSIDLSVLDTADDIWGYYYMFKNCSSLTTLDISTLNQGGGSNVSMFDGCTSLTTIYASEDWSTAATDSDDMFKDCTSLTGYNANKTDGSYATIGNGGYFTEKHSLANKTYKQTAHKNGKYYTRFVISVPKTDFAGKSRAKFTVDNAGTQKTCYKECYYRVVKHMMYRGGKYRRLRVV